MVLEPTASNAANSTGIRARRHSVANTAKRAIIIVGCAIAFGESMAPLKMIGCSIAIGGIAAGFEVALLRRWQRRPLAPRLAFLRAHAALLLSLRARRRPPRPMQPQASRLIKAWGS